MSLSEAIAATANAIERAFQDTLVEENAILNGPIDFANLTGVATVCEEQLRSSMSQLQPPIDVADVEDEAIKTKIVSFRGLFLDKSGELVVAVSLQSLADKLGEQYIAEIGNEAGNTPSTVAVTIANDILELTKEDLAFFCKLFLLLDAFVYLVLEKYSGAKPSFYVCLSNILDLLFNVSPKAINTFWYYMDTRFLLFEEKMFDANAVSDRISLLELTNRITDKFYIFKRKDSYQKDSFNDKLDARIRLFVSNILLFEDNTGLNKYFSVSNRVVNETIPTGKYKTNDSFLKGAIQLQKLFNDPYYFLKQSNHRILREYVDVMRDVVDHLLQQEISENRSKKGKGNSDHYSSVQPKKSEAEEANLKAKYKSMHYFPELYWISPFENLRGTHYDELKAKDLDFWNNQFKSSKFRRTYLLQVYIVTGMLVELTASNKKELLKSINAPASVKHITEDSTIETFLPSIIRLRKRFRDVMKQCDEKFFFLLQHLAVNELYWWGWLIYNKNTDGKPFFSKPPLSQEDIDTVKEKFKTVVPFKEKRYFNLYATPQLSRKMKIATGLELLKKDNLPDIDLLKSKLSALRDKASVTEDLDELKQLKEQISFLRWKVLKVERTYDWLDFGKTIDRLDFMLAEELEEPEAALEEPATKKVKLDEALATAALSA